MTGLVPPRTVPTGRVAPEIGPAHIEVMANRTQALVVKPRPLRGSALRRCAGWMCCLAGLLVAAASPAWADYAAGLAAFNAKDYKKAYSEWIEPAKAGEAPAEHGIGMLYDMGEGVPDKSPKAAAEWYQKAADQNYAPAINNLARLYADGRGVKADPAKAIELWSRAAEAGNVTARFNLGVQYANGSGVKKDPVKAAEYLRQAAEGGLAEAQFALAGFYREGIGVKQDPEAARLWYQRSADAGFEPARTAVEALDQAAQNEAAKAKQQPATGEAASVPSEGAVSEQSAVDAQTPAPEAKPAETAHAEAAPAETAPAESAPTQEAAAPKAPEAAPAAAEMAATESTPTPEPAAESHPAEEAAPAPEATPPPPAPEAESHPAEEPAPAAEAQPAAEPVAKSEPEPVGEGSAAMNSMDPGANLPLAESLTGETMVYRIWLYDSGQEKDASSYWAKLTQKYPGLLKNLKVDLRRYFLGEAKGALYRVFAGPFDSLAAAQKACEDIKQRFGDQFCRPVIN